MESRVNSKLEWEKEEKTHKTNREELAGVDIRAGHGNVEK